MHKESDAIACVTKKLRQGEMDIFKAHTAVVLYIK